MKIVAENHADMRRRTDTDAPETLLLDTVGDELRALYADAAADLPEALLALATRVDRARKPTALAA